MSSTTASPTKRLPAHQRRELILAAAAKVFGERGYVGATTDSVAREAGVSQPYVVRMFGSKSALFEAVLDRSLDRLLDMFRLSAREHERELASDPDAGIERCIGRNYVELLRDRGILLSLMQAFMLGADPEIGTIARAGWMRVYRCLRDELGMTPEAVVEVLSVGMLINTLVGLQLATEWEDADVHEMIATALPLKADVLRDLARGDTEAGPARR